MPTDLNMDLLDEIATTAERVERFRLMHEDAIRDLREKIAQARAAGFEHDTIDGALQQARTTGGRFQRLPKAG